MSRVFPSIPVLLTLSLLCTTECTSTISRYESSIIGQSPELVNFTLDWDGKILFLPTSGEYLLRLDTTLSFSETIPLPERIFHPKKILANLSYLFISSQKELFIFARREGLWKKVLAFDEILDFTLSSSGELFLLIRGERKLKRLDRFLNLSDFPYLDIDPTSYSITSLDDKLYLLNQKKEVVVFSTTNYQKRIITFKNLEDLFLFSPYQEGERVYLFSQKGKVFSLKGEDLNQVDTTKPLLSCFPHSSYLFLLSKDSGVERILQR